jgi:hypothetical protein
MKSPIWYPLLGMILISLLALPGCKEEEPLKDVNNQAYTAAQAEIVKLRMGYSVKLNGWQPKQGEPDTPPELILDIAVVNENRKRRLSNLTVLVTQLDTEGRKLREDRLVLPVDDLTPGSSHFITGRGLACAEGLDGVTVKLEPDPPVEALGEYREFY